MERIIDLCVAALAKFHGVEIVRDDPYEFLFDTGDKAFVVSIDSAEVEEEEEGGDSFLRKRQSPRYIEDHSSVLAVCLAAMSEDAETAAAVFDFTVDGDGKDCEAIFNHREEGWLRLKVR